MKNYVFWYITQCSLLKITWHSEEHIPSIFRVEEKAKQEALLTACFMLASCLAYPSSVKMKATHSCKSHWTTLRYIPANRTLFYVMLVKLFQSKYIISAM
jgi:hypothetical protein